MYFNAHKWAPTLTPKYISSQNIYPTASRFTHRYGLLFRTQFTQWFAHPVYTPIRPNRSVQTDPVLSLCSRSGQCWVCISTHLCQVFLRLSPPNWRVDRARQPNPWGVSLVLGYLPTRWLVNVISLEEFAYNNFLSIPRLESLPSLQTMVYILTSTFPSLPLPWTLRRRFEPAF